MPEDLFALVSEWFGRSDWDVCLLPPDDGRPRLLMQFGERYSPLPYELTEASRESLRRLKAGTPRIEARGAQDMVFDLVPLDHQALGWRLSRNPPRLALLDRDRSVIAVYFDPRPVVTQLDQVVAWVQAEWAANRVVIPNERADRARCSDAVGFNVTRQMLRNAVTAARAASRDDNLFVR
jgi:hypothetical protein